MSDEVLCMQPVHDGAETTFCGIRAANHCLYPITDGKCSWLGTYCVDFYPHHAFIPPKVAQPDREARGSVPSGAERPRRVGL